ncbi:MAG: YgjV family protein [Inconstantimicrobium porci]|uniref:YgjV family protein n=1 Tax=Inconstantimicrobium porci TaxID=2652291 RepID=UPI0024091CB5|nr:YgjV family protein [Inconstantimicrobium porci]MDD6769359.1 YgjV family protein [Inconstantimicrobium porci]MDY5911411.1 YgjV family protein [Inconstantimicrobium porci]
MGNWVEYIGYGASILVGLSMFMKDIMKLRFVNTIGCLLFVIYSFFIKAYPVAIVNIIIIFVNLYYLYTMMKDDGK